MPADKDRRASSPLTLNRNPGVLTVWEPTFGYRTGLNRRPAASSHSSFAMTNIEVTVRTTLSLQKSQPLPKWVSSTIEDIMDPLGLELGTACKAAVMTATLWNQSEMLVLTLASSGTLGMSGSSARDNLW